MSAKLLMPDSRCTMRASPSRKTGGAKATPKATPAAGEGAAPISMSILPAWRY